MDSNEQAPRPDGDVEAGRACEVEATPPARERGGRVRRRGGCRASARRVRAAAPRPHLGPHRALDRTVPLPPLPQQYTRTAVLAGPGMPGEFRRSLSGLALGPLDAVYALGDGRGPRVRGGRTARARVARAGEGVVPDRGRRMAASRSALRAAWTCSTTPGTTIGGFAAGTRDKPADVTAVRLVRDSILVADAAARVDSPVRRPRKRTGRHRRAEQDGRLHAAEPEPRLRRRCGRRRPRRGHGTPPGDVVDARRDAWSRRSASSAWHGPRTSSAAATR